MSSELATYPPTEKERIESLKSILPPAESVLEIGARDGRFTEVLARVYPRIVALDLERPAWRMTGVETVQGNVQGLDFAIGSFDLVVCTEVLEHVPRVEQAAKEIVRVSREYALIGVPFRQDIRLGRTTCRSCGRANPPYGHVNTFDAARLHRMFAPMVAERVEFVGAATQARTNALSTWLMDRAGNPWGTYSQEERCVHCGSEIEAPKDLATGSRVLAAGAERLRRITASFSQPQPTWIHVLYRSSRIPRHAPTRA